MAAETPSKPPTTLGLTGLTSNAMALIAPGAFLWLTFFIQSAYGAPLAAQGMWFGILAAVVLCLATAGLWVRSYWVVDRYGFSPLHSVATDRGSLVFCRIDPDLNLMVERGYHRDPAPNPTSGWNPRQAARRTWNLFVAHGEDFPGFKMVVIELWPPVWGR